ncbi:MAG: TRAP transporter substrate-binding protein DctP [Polyangiales bacterium]
MKRFRLGLLALAFGLAAGIVAGRGADAQPAPAAPAGRTLSLATLAPAGSTWMRVLEAWNRELRRRTNKALSLRIYPGGVQGDESEVIRKIRAGRLDGGAVTAVGLSKVHRPALVFQMPGMFRSNAQLDAARRATQDEVNRAFDSAGFSFLGWADVGFSRVFSRVPIRTPADMGPTHPYVWRDDLVMPALYEEAHVRPVPMQLPEVLTALQTNRVDSFVTTPVAAISLQWTTRVTHMTDVPVSVVVGATIFGKAQVESLPADQQTALRETATQFHQLLISNLRRDEVSAVRSIGNRGITVVTVGDAERAQWNSLFQRTRARLVGRIADQAFVSRVTNAAR